MLLDQKLITLYLANGICSVNKEMDMHNFVYTCSFEYRFHISTIIFYCKILCINFIT